MVLLVFTLSNFWVGVMMTGVCLAVVFMSYTLVTGEGGMLWLCQMTFAGAGALTTAQLATRHGWPILLAVVGGGVIAAAMGTLIGVFTIRLGNLYIALVTLTFGLLMEVLIFPLNTFSNSGVGFALERPGFADSNRAYTLFVLGVFAVVAVLTVNLRRSTTGLALNAVRWSETASRTMGLSVIQMKLLISALAAFVAGVGGGLYAVANKQAIPSEYAILLGLIWLAVLVTFGVRSNIAALLAGFFFVMSPAFVRSELKLDSTWQQVPVLLFGLGAIALAKNNEGTVHQWAMGLQRGLHKIVGRDASPPTPEPESREQARSPRVAEVGGS
jgi:branched-chain amino acid transport system permease protein